MDFHSALEAIHERHVAVHQDQWVAVALLSNLVQLVVVLNLLKCLLSIHGLVTQLRVDSQLVLKDRLQSINVEDLVVNQ